MSLKTWLEKYSEIAKFMGYDIERDRRATRILAGIIKAYRLDPPLSMLKELLSDKPTMIFGAGPSLDETIDGLLQISPDFSQRFTLITADGATQALVEREKVPHIVVTDLDGDIDALLYSAERGSIIVVHAHGDNIEKITQYMGKVASTTRLIIGTTQVEPVSPLQNFGGFTDGDRAVFMASYYKAALIILVGMDFGRIVGKRSKPWLTHETIAWEDKLKKLEIAYKLISQLALEFDLKIYTTSEITPPGTKRVCLEEINKIVGGRH